MAGVSVAEKVHVMASRRANAVQDTAADFFKGQVTLPGKGCLNCHSLRREGGRIEPDLADRRAACESAAAWAVARWAHTPRMAAMAHRKGIASPRFSGREMGNLLDFLRSTAVAQPSSASRAAPTR